VGTPDFGASQVAGQVYPNGVLATLPRAHRPRPISGFTNVWLTGGLPSDSSVPGDFTTNGSTAYISPIWNAQRFDESWVELVSTTPGSAVSTAGSAVSGTGSQTVTPVAMRGIGNGMYLLCDTGASQEMVVVTGSTGSTFTAVFAKMHSGRFTITAPPLIVCATYEDYMAYGDANVYWQLFQLAVPTAQLLMQGVTITPHHVWQWSEADLIATAGQQPAMSRRARGLKFIWQEGTAAGAIRGGFGWRTTIS